MQKTDIENNKVSLNLDILKFVYRHNGCSFTKMMNEYMIRFDFTQKYIDAFTSLMIESLLELKKFGFIHIISYSSSSDISSSSCFLITISGVKIVEEGSLSR